MKKVLVLIAMMVALTCEGLNAQAKPLPTWVSGTKSARSAWFDTTTVTTTSFQYVNGWIYNMGTDTIFVAKDVDTAMTSYVAVRPGYTQPIWSQFKKLRVKARTDGTLYQYHFE
jgi:hypothetical protein